MCNPKLIRCSIYNIFQRFQIYLDCYKSLLFLISFLVRDRPIVLAFEYAAFSPAPEIELSILKIKLFTSLDLKCSNAAFNKHGFCKNDKATKPEDLLIMPCFFSILSGRMLAEC